MFSDFFSGILTLPTSFRLTLQEQCLVPSGEWRRDSPGSGVRSPGSRPEGGNAGRAASDNRKSAIDNRK